MFSVWSFYNLSNFDENAVGDFFALAALGEAISLLGLFYISKITSKLKLPNIELPKLKISRLKLFKYKVNLIPFSFSLPTFALRLPKIQFSKITKVSTAIVITVVIITGLIGNIIFKSIPAFAAAVPNVNASSPPSTMVGENLSLTLTFNNAGTVVRYGPYIDVVIPTTGADGNDGLSFNNVTYLGQPVVSVSQVFPSTGNTAGCSAGQSFVLHPFALDNTGAAIHVCGKIGDTLMVA